MLSALKSGGYFRNFQYRVPFAIQAQNRSSISQVPFFLKLFFHNSHKKPSIPQKKSSLHNFPHSRGSFAIHPNTCALYLPLFLIIIIIIIILLFNKIGVVSEEKLMDLLDPALSGRTANTVKTLREILETGVDPTALMSQLATFITDVLAGAAPLAGREAAPHRHRLFFRHDRLGREETERLRQALKVLSEAEKQLRASNDKITWLTASLLQLAPDKFYTNPTPISSSKRIAEQEIVEEEEEEQDARVLRSGLRNEGETGRKMKERVGLGERNGSRSERGKVGVGERNESRSERGKVGVGERNVSRSERETGETGRNNMSLVKGKVSLAQVINRFEGSSGGWSRQKAISIAEKLEKQNLRLESRSRRLFCWRAPRVSKAKMQKLKIRVLKRNFAICTRGCLCAKEKSP